MRRVSLSACFRLKLLVPALVCAVCMSTPVLLGQDIASLNTGHLIQPEPPRAEPQSPVTVTSEESGDILVARGQYAAAIRVYREGASDTAVYWNKLGIAYHHLFAITEAKRDYQRALQLNPKYAEAMNNLGTIFYAQKDYKHAERMYNRSLKLTPNSAVAYSNLGTAYIAQRKYKKGVQAYERAFGLDPKVFDPNYGGKVEENGPAHEMGKLNFYLAETYAKAGMKEQALLYLRRALAEGFDDRKKIMADKELATLRETPEFHLLMVSRRME